MGDEKMRADESRESLEDAPCQVIFRILQDTRLPFSYALQQNGTYRADQDQGGIIAAEQAGYIEIIESDVPANLRRFTGGPEPILDNGLCYVVPGDGPNVIEGSSLEIKRFGDWECRRCGFVTYVPINGKVIEPFECENDACGRKGHFKEKFPMHLVKVVWKIPLTPIETSGIDVYTSVYDYCRKYLVLIEDEYHLLTLWIMASWLVDDFQTCPYLAFIAPKSSGKTQGLNVLGELAYRALNTISVTAAGLFRAIELWHVTLLIDEAEHQVKLDTEAGQALYGCLNGGYKRGSYAIRIEGDNSNRVPTSYDVFGFKAIASTKLFHPILESRSIVINMSQGMPENVMLDSGKGATIRSKLLYWRLETLGKLPLILPHSKVGRLIEMFTPLFTVAQILKDSEGVKKPISYEELLKLLNCKIAEMESQRKAEEQESVEAQILEAILNLIDNPEGRVFGERDSIAVKDVADHLRTQKGWEEILGREKIATTVGRKLKVMGVSTKHTNHGKIIEYLNDSVRLRLDELEKRYTVTDGDGK